jgi:hypothetical protein
MRLVIRIGLGILVAVQLGTGLWQLLLPESFYSDFPTVDLAPPFNEHLMRDFGGANVAIGVIVLAVAVWFEKRYVQLVLLAYLAFSIPHLIFHMTHLHGATTGDVVFQVLALGGAVVLPIVVLALVPRAFREAPRAE